MLQCWRSSARARGAEPGTEGVDPSAAVKGEAMSNFPEVLGMVIIFFFLTLLPLSAILVAVLSKHVVDNALVALMTRGASKR